MFSKVFLSHLALSIGGLSVASCVAATHKFPTYSYEGVDLLAQVTGSVSNMQGCYILAANSPPDTNFVLVFPKGSKITEAHIIMPLANGGNKVSLSKAIAAQGGIDTFDDDKVISNPTGCTGNAFIVNRISNDD